LEIVRGDAYGVKLTADDNIIDHVQATKAGDALHIRLEENQAFQNGTWKLAITMPRLQTLTLSGASTATLKGFKDEKSFTAKIGGASSLKGEMSANSVSLSGQGASRITLKGSAKNATFVAGGASQLQLKDFTAGTARVEAHGASRVVVNASDRLEYQLSGAARLQYCGHPTLGKHETSGAAHAERLRD
jgi:hypothetical protein